MFEDSILQSIEASFNPSKLVEAFSAVLSIMKQQQNEIALLTGQLQTVNEKFEGLEKQLNEITERTYGEESAPSSSSRPALTARSTANKNRISALNITPVNVAPASSKSVTISSPRVLTSRSRKNSLKSPEPKIPILDKIDGTVLISTKHSTRSNGNAFFFGNSSRTNNKEDMIASDPVQTLNNANSVENSEFDKAVELAASQSISLERDPSEAKSISEMMPGEHLFNLSTAILNMNDEKIEQILSTPIVRRPSITFPDNSSRKTPTNSQKSRRLSGGLLFSPSALNGELTFQPLFSPASSVQNQSVINTIEEGQDEDAGGSEAASPITNGNSLREENKSEKKSLDNDDLSPMTTASNFEFDDASSIEQLPSANNKSSSKPISKSRTSKPSKVMNLSFLDIEKKDSILRELRGRGHFIKACKAKIEDTVKRERNKKISLPARISEIEATIQTILGSLDSQKKRIRNAIAFSLAHSSHNAAMASSHENNARTSNEKQAPSVQPDEPVQTPSSVKSILSTATRNVFSSTPSSVATSKEKHMYIHMSYANDSDNRPGSTSRRSSSNKDIDVPPSIPLAERLYNSGSERHDSTISNASGAPLGIILGPDGRLPVEFIKAVKLQLDEINQPEQRLPTSIESSKPATAMDMLYVKQQISTIKALMVTRQDLEEMNINQTLTSEDKNRRSSQAPNELANPRMTREQVEALISETRAQLEGSIMAAAEATKVEIDEIRHAMNLRTNNLQDDMKKLHYNVKRVADEIDSLNTKFEEENSDTVEGNSLRAQIKKISGGLFVQSEKQLRDYKELTNALQRMHLAVDGKPSVTSVEKMVDLTESTFRRLLGQNITGVNQAVLQVVKAVQQKADKDEITKLIAKRMFDLEVKVKSTIETGDDIAGSLKCLSCGHHYKPRTASSLETSSTDHLPNQGQEGDDMTDMDFDGLRDSSLTSLSVASCPPSSSGGLKVNRPNSSGEPLYRRARQAASNREAVKQPLRLTTPSLPVILSSAGQSSYPYVLDPDISSNPHVIFPESKRIGNSSASSLNSRANSAGSPNRSKQ